MRILSLSVVDFAKPLTVPVRWNRPSGGVAILLIVIWPDLDPESTNRTRSEERDDAGARAGPPEPSCRGIPPIGSARANEWGSVRYATLGSLDSAVGRK